MSNYLTIESVNLEGQGIARREGKTIFVDGGITGEVVQTQTLKVKNRYELAEVTHICKPSNARVQPHCPHFGVCGGCSLQHIHPNTQIAIKQRALEDCLWHIGQLKAPQILPPIQGPNWAYRYRARLSMRFLPHLDKFIIGFKEKKSRYIADLSTCPILPKQVNSLIQPLQELFYTLDIRDSIPQLEVAIGHGQTVLSLRHLKPLNKNDIKKLKDFSEKYPIYWWVQAQGPQSVKPLFENQPPLYYELPEFNLKMNFKPTDFTQVNPMMNRAMVLRAMTLLQPQHHERILDLFCGLGNFTLPIARHAKEVIGVEGSSTLTERAKTIAKEHQLHKTSSFQVQNLFEIDAEWFLKLGRFDKILLDPPRDGAVAVAKAISQLPQEYKPKKIVYVSCSPSTLARDLAILVHTGGYQLKCASVLNMFVHTGHIESIVMLTYPSQ